MDSPLRSLYKATTIVELLHEFSNTIGPKIAITISADKRDTNISFRSLLERGQKAGAWLQKFTDQGDRVILSLSTCPEFIDFFFGCILTGRIAVPLPVEKSTSRFSRLETVLKDCNPKLIITKVDADLNKLPKDIEGCKCVSLENQNYLQQNILDTQSVDIAPNQVALIQYTSGSTSSPKGVVLTHSNLINNIRMIQQGMQITSQERVVSWLPLHHDMGLIGMLLTFVSAGAYTYIYPYQEFARNPLSWLEAMTEKKSTLSGAPTFAYDAIVKKLKNHKDHSFNLVNLRLLYCGSERISPPTINDFYQILKPSGISEKSFFPCYGLAEASLYVSGQFKEVGHLCKESKIGYPPCGWPANGLTVNIYDNNGNTLPPGEIGQIQIKGPSVSPGYWNDIAKDISNGIFLGVTSHQLNTGDLGYFSGSELHVTGRLKDLIKIHGQNIFPEDIEILVEQIIDFFPTNSVVAVGDFDTNTASEAVTIIAEIDRHQKNSDFQELHKKVQLKVGEIGIRVERLVIISPLTLPKTSSGKKQRARTLKLLHENSLKVIFDSKQECVPGSSVNIPEKHLNSPRLNEFKSYISTLNFTLNDERRTFPADFINRIREFGFLKLLVPQEYGGCALSNQDFAKLSINLGEMDISVAACVGNHNTIGVLPIIYSKVFLDREKVLKQISAHGQIAAFALTEPEAGSNPRLLNSSIKTIGNKLILNGEKVWIGNAGLAEYVTVFAREFDSTGQDLGISAFLLRRSLHKFELGEEQLTLGLRAMPQNRVLFKDVHLREEDRLTLAGEGMQLAFKVMEYARFGLAAMVVGALRTAYRKTIGFAKTRPIWTGLLINNAYFRSQLYLIDLRLTALEATVTEAALYLDSRREMPVGISLICKILAGEWGFSGVDTCLQFTGGRGYLETFGMARFWKDIRVLRIFEGPTETLAFQLGTLVLREDPSVMSLLEDPTELLQIMRHWRSEFDGIVSNEIVGTLVGLFTAQYISLRLLYKDQVDNLKTRRTILENLRSLADEFTLRLTQSKNYGNFEINFDLEPSPSQSNRPFFDTWAGELSSKDPLVSKETTHPLENKSTFQVIKKTDSKIELTTDQPKISVENIIMELSAWLQKHTRYKEIDVSRPLSEFGIDSLLAYELLCFVEDVFKVILPEAVIHRRPCLKELANIIDASARGKSELSRKEIS